ncbi:MAG: hypothetical protein MK077_10685 [Phycisphaerales bacterium]|nr:hypothetical protein [Phycisphaerales bacterium]
MPYFPSNALVVPWTRLAALRVIFLSWVNHLLKADLEISEASNARLQALLGKKAKSIWNLHKVDLVQIAMDELGMTLAYAERQSVVSLREKIRRKRQELTHQEDPKNRLPPNVDRMKKLDLLNECLIRDLPLPEGASRPMMIVAIRDDVEQRQLLQGHVTENERKAKDPQSPTTADGDWQMADTPSPAASPRPRREVPKGKGKSLKVTAHFPEQDAKEKKDGQ